ncbi:MAG: alpha/beta hydrolase-fold protein [Vicinamibacterales bacterium]|jgi:hypothetical protein|nr:hypothetical protein [Acidobacteriota bacterium]MDP7211246.1 alpha/beta hydrolase-fold protein [Vicinamibacterales bacterium]HJO16941.1 alpha/beta hydrolase-fold protein [Vicinamibacterales bacterium]|tara:strand:+ start:1059 stop:2717 length:1659 start_codon:yes stop_codon:yes gene_type:complete
MRAKRPNSPALDSRSFRVAGVVTAIFVAAITALVPLLASGEQRFEVSFPSAVHEEALTGRIYVMISRTAEREPRLQIGRTGVPFFGRDVVNLLPGEPGIIDATDLGTPVASLRDIPAGDYYVQAFVNVYSEFRRADGHVIWMHDDRWEGQHWNRSPGNLYSAVERVRLDPEADAVIALSAENAIPPVVVPPDTEWVRRFKFQSSMLTEFWGRPVYLGATVLLPRGYDSSTISYPVNYIQGHFSLNAPNRFQIGDDLYREWIRDDFPRMILVTFQHPNPYFDDSYAVNSVNVGPYGDAILQELIPEIEKRFRILAEPYARVLSGGSTGGWESLALQIFHPDFFGGTWSYCPDPVTFTDVEGINIYEDVNAFYKQHEWRRVPTANTREINGEIRLTSRQRNHFELVNGTKGRSGEQLDIWSAVFGPIGDDGYFEPLFDKRTGEINAAVAEYWRDNYDLLHYLRQNWAEIGQKLVDKLHIYTGTMDNFYLNNSTRDLELWMKTTENPHYEGFFMYGDGKGHCFSGPVTRAARLREMAQFIMRKKPDGATTPWWRY